MFNKSLRFLHYFSLLSNDHYGHDSNSELAGLHEQLLLYMQTDIPFLNSKLTLGELSLATKIPENQLPQIFTKHLRSNFYQFVNTYRPQEFERQVEQTGIEQLSIMGLAGCVGFFFYGHLLQSFQIAVWQYAQGIHSEEKRLKAILLYSSVLTMSKCRKCVEGIFELIEAKTQT